MHASALVLGLALAATSVSATQTAGRDDLPARIAALGRINGATTPSLSPDGNRMAYLSNQSGSPQIWIRDLKSGADRQLTNLPDPVGGLEWSPTSDQLAYSVLPGGGLNTQIWVVNADGSGARRLTPGGKENNGFAGWSRDGAYLFVDTNKDNPSARDPALINVATGAWTMLASNKGLNGIADMRGDKVVIGRVMGRGDNNAYLIDRRTGSETLLTPHEG
jgi:Tol biopolymer transport system component